MSALLLALGDAVRAVVHAGLGSEDHDVETTLAEVNERREACTSGAVRRAQLALEHEGQPDPSGDEWLGYAALLVHVDRIVRDLTGPPPS